MENKVRYLQQTLHGYNCGHHLLASSVKLCEKSMRKMEKLSDLSGNTIEKGFEQYYTGYYLAEEHYYVIASTWYAPEMNRPGCVWTHSLLIKENDMHDWMMHITEFLDLFKRPQNIAVFTSYEKELTLPYTKEDTIVFNADRMKYIMWAMWGKNNPVIVPVSRANEYITELLYILFSQYPNLPKGFSFSTGALSIRQYDKELLHFQMILKGALRAAVGDRKVSILEDSEYIAKYPLWIDALYDMLIKNNMRELSQFVEEFPVNLHKSRYISMFMKMYLALDIQHGNFNFIDCLQIVDALGDCKELLVKSLQNLYLKKYRDIRIDNVALMRVSLTKEWINLDYRTYLLLVRNSLKEQITEARRFVKEIAYMEECNKIDTILKQYANVVSMDFFEYFTDADIDVCCLFVTLNPKFALASFIWMQDKNFQRSILQCLKGQTIEVEIKKAIIEQIIKTSNQDLCYNIYIALGEQSIPYLLNEVCKQGIKYVQQYKSLKKVCNLKTEVCFMFLCERAKTGQYADDLFFVELFNPHKLNLSLNEFETMLTVFKRLKSSELFSEFESKIARFYIILILRSEFKFPDDILSICYRKIYNELANQEFPQDEWEKMEYLMPEFGYHNWDRCKRLKKSLKKKGYEKKEFESDGLEVYLL